MIAGKRFTEHVDIFSFGLVLYEISMRQAPYHKVREEFKANGGKGFNRKMFINIATGKLREEIRGSDVRCKQYGVSKAFRKRELLAISAGRQR